MQPNNQSQIPELQDIARKHTVDALETKIERCYTKDRHDIFQDDVIKIVHKELRDDDARKNLDTYVQAKIDKTLTDRGLKNRNFWWPVILGGLGALGSIGATIVAIVALKK